MTLPRRPRNSTRRWYANSAGSRPKTSFPSSTSSFTFATSATPGSRAIDDAIDSGSSDREMSDTSP
jgi:hypothetical protein